MKIVEPKHYTSAQELYSNLDSVLEELKASSIVCIRGLNFSREDQLELVKILGDVAGWTPNTSTNFNHQYTESHSSSPSLPGSEGSQIILKWHMEHIDYDNYSPIVAGVWNMQKFTCSPDVGMTYFIDSRNIYEMLFSEEEKKFLRKSEASWLGLYPENRQLLNNANVVTNHWLDSREQIRLEMHQISTLDLFKFDGQDPTDEQKDYFQLMVAKFVSEVYTNEDLRIVHQWREGDILIPDLHCLAHAVTGGFSPEQREFTGLWCFAGSPEKLSEDELHPSWK
jgi:alpha-ketoglutarate-dependent taurine dioxygenase